jgi:hypothetical protein
MRARRCRADREAAPQGFLNCGIETCVPGAELAGNGSRAAGTSKSPAHDSRFKKIL